MFLNGRRVLENTSTTFSWSGRIDKLAVSCPHPATKPPQMVDGQLDVSSMRQQSTFFPAACASPPLFAASPP